MRDLLLTVDPSTWTQISVCVFSACFIYLVLFVYWPSRKKIYERYSALPLGNDDLDQQ